MEKLRKILGRNARMISERKQGLYRLTPKDVSSIEYILKLQMDVCVARGDWKGYSRCKRILGKFI
jgi:hypothetical protein